MTEHIKVRNQLKNISSYTSFIELLDKCMLSDEDKELMRLFYLKQKTLDYIADELGIAEVTARKKHTKILKKLSKLM